MNQLITQSLQLHIIAIIFGLFITPLMVPLMFRTGQYVKHQKSKTGGGLGGANNVWMKLYGDKPATPNMGGILIWFGLPTVYVIGIALELLTRHFLLELLLYGMSLYGLVGFIDVLTTNIIKANPELREKQERFEIRLLRFAISIVPSIYLMWSYFNGYVGLQDIWELSLYIAITSVISHFAVYAGELIDGIDGLMIGVFGIIYLGLLAIALITGNTVFVPIISIILGLIFADFVFNSSPALFYNGGPGAMPLSFGAFFIALAMGQLLPYFIITLITWITMFSSMGQILSMKLFKKRILPIAPLHHTFQIIGWSDNTIVMRYLQFTIASVIIALAIVLF